MSRLRLARSREPPLLLSTTMAPLGRHTVQVSVPARLGAPGLGGLGGMFPPIFFQSIFSLWSEGLVTRLRDDAIGIHMLVKEKSVTYFPSLSILRYDGIRSPCPLLQTAREKSSRKVQCSSGL